MADYQTEFSCTFDVGTAENAQAALAIRTALATELEDDEGCEIGFQLELDPLHGPGVLWISSDGYGEPEHVIMFVLGCAEAFDLTGRWGFIWALTCSKPRLDGFGGGAQLIDLGERRSLAWLDCEHWLASNLDPAVDADASVAQSVLPDGAWAMAANIVPPENDTATGRSPRFAAPTMRHSPAVLPPENGGLFCSEAMMPNTAFDLARHLARDAEAVCRHYLSNGRRHGRYWLVGDIDNTPGRSLYVRLSGPESGEHAAGKWTDAQTGEHGDLLDLITARERHSTLRDTLDEARRFLSLPRPEPSPRPDPVPQGSPGAARRLFAMAKPIRGTIAKTYLRGRGLTELHDCTGLRFHPRCWYRGDEKLPGDTARDAWPALIAAVTNDDGTITGVHRTWLDPSSATKAPVSTPRRSLGLINGHGVRIGRSAEVMATGEGLETMLSLRVILPTLPMIAAGSANHLDALILPGTLRRLYVAEDADYAGRRVTASVMHRAEAAGIEALRLAPVLGDFNDDLQRLGSEALRAALRVQLAPEDVNRFWCLQVERSRAA